MPNWKNERGVEIFVQTGSLRVAETPERAREIRDLVEMGRQIGFDIDHLAIDEVAQRLPYMQTDDLLDACYCPTDGHLQPAELVSAYLTIGREHGVVYRSSCPVRDLEFSGGRVCGVVTDQGTISTGVVINAAGPWSYLVADLVDAPLQTAALGHVYLTTRPDDRHPVDRLSPAIRDRHLRLYSRPESGGLIVGRYGSEVVQHDMGSLPDDFDMSALSVRPDDLHVALLIDATKKRFPWIDERTPMTITRGIMTFTPDGKPLCGKRTDIDGLFHCSGFCGHGIVQSPVIGVIMADLVLDGHTDYDIEAIHADRFFEHPELQTRPDIEAAAARCSPRTTDGSRTVEAIPRARPQRVSQPYEFPGAGSDQAGSRHRRGDPSRPDGMGVDTSHLSYLINPFDAIAVEEALRLRERRDDVEVVAVGIGGEAYEDELRTALAMGADRAIRVDAPEPLDPWNVAEILAELSRRLEPRLVLMGKQAVDDDSAQAGQFLAARLGWPQATFASQIDDSDDGATVARETDHGIETIAVPGRR